VSSREVRIIDNGESYTVTTGENVVIGHARYFASYGFGPGTATRRHAIDMASLFISQRRSHPTLSDSAIVARCIERGWLPGPTPDDN
jgi:hypothetical protein